MKKVALIVGALLALGAGAALAQAPPGLNLAWDDCWEAAPGNTNKTVNCTNSSIAINHFRLCSSFVLGAPIPELAASEAYVDIQVDSPTLPAWWNPSAARYESAITGSSCFDVWNTDPQTPITSGHSFLSGQAPNRLRIFMPIAFRAPYTYPADPGIEYANHRISLKFSLGTFNNAGCLTPACIVFQQLDLFQPGTLPKTVLTSPSANHHVTWRTPSANTPCPQATPTRRATWGSIKALYR